MATKTMSRRAFIESVDATCSNWQWSWSFVNHSERFVAFGAWDVNTMGRRCLIPSGKWQFKDTGRTTLGEPQSREHIRLVAQEGYSMMTFRMKWPNSRQDEDGNGLLKIGLIHQTAV